MEFRKTLILIAAIAAASVGLSCRSLLEIGERAGGAKETAQAAISQAQAVATQSSMVIGTAQAFATQNPALVGTAQAFFSEQGPVLLATAQALATQQPGLIETAQALVTQGLSGEDRPGDIPLPPVETEIFFSTRETISFSAPLNLQETLDFYRQEMSARGWQLASEGTVETGNTAILNYIRPGQAAILSFTYSSGDGKTFVLASVRSD